MTVTAVTKNPEALSMAISAEFEATPERVWQLWADPRQLERWWGPPDYPATFEAHDLRPGSRVSYFMTTPEGDTPRGYWDVLEVDAPRRLVPGAGLPSSVLRDGMSGRERGAEPDAAFGQVVTQLRGNTGLGCAEQGEECQRALADHMDRRHAYHAV